MTGLHYPDNLYADHEERKARRTQAPTRAYRAPAEIPEAERKLRTARHHLYHALLLVDEALGDNEPKAQREAKIAYDVASDGISEEALRKLVDAQPGEVVPVERVPKWDPKWVEACPQRAHPMQAETIRDHDERLAGGEDRL